MVMGSCWVTVKEAKATGLSFDKKEVSTGIGKEETVMIKDGTAPYTVKVKDEKIATATIKDSKLMVKGVKAGKTTVTVTDKEKKTGILEIVIK